MKKYSVITLLLFAVIGCATSGSGPSKYRSRAIPASYDALLESTIDYLMERGYSIANWSAETGDFETEYRTGAGWSRAFAGDKRAKVLGKVARVDDGQAKLTLTIISEERDQYSGWQEVTMDVGREQIFYNNYFDAIETRAKQKN